MKKIVAIGLILALTLALALVLTGCGSKPETAVENFFGAVKAFDSEALTETLAPSATDDLGDVSKYLEDNSDPFDGPFIDYFKDNAKKITYEVTGSKVDGDEATVTVKCKYVDGSGLFTKIVPEIFKVVLSEAFANNELTEEEVEQLVSDLFIKHLETATETFTEKTIDIECIKVDGTWYVKTVSDELADVVSSNLFTVAKGFAEKFGE